MPQIYCVKCKTKTADVGLTESVAKNGRKMVQATCAKCGTKKTQFVPSGTKGGFINVRSFLPF